MIGRPDEVIRGAVKANWDAIAKPLDGMGRFEEMTAQIGAITGDERLDLSEKAVLIFCADNGIVAEGVSQAGQEVTLAVAKSMAKNASSVGRMARFAGADTIPVDIGINSDLTIDGVLDKKIAHGTRDFLIEPAMSEEETLGAIETGIALVAECKDKGYRILATGEMGIGNTTTSAAVAASLLKCKSSEIAGRGAGLSDEGLKKKISVIQSAIEKYSLYEKSVLEVLQTVGGFDLAGMAGVCLAAKKYGIPVVLDGAVSMVSALVAEKLESGICSYLVPSHKSREPLASKVAATLNLEPVLDAGMALGEGTGAVLMMNVIKSALEVYENCVPFEKSGVEQYQRYD